MLIGRTPERQALDQLLADARDGRSRALVIRGEAGAGKSALLGVLTDRAAGFRVVRATGLQSESELAYAGVHQVVAGLEDGLSRLPDPQLDALETALGRRSGARPDRFLVALALLSLIGDASIVDPLLCVVEDSHWLDRASLEALAFVARRLSRERAAMVFAARLRPETPALTGIDELTVQGLDPASAGELLDATLPVHPEPQVRERIVAETGGNPLAIIELPRSWSRAELESGLLLPPGSALTGELEAEFSRRCATLPAETRELLLIAAAEPFGDPVIVRRAAERAGIDPFALTAAVAADLCSPGADVVFRHPLARSACYFSAAPEDRRRVHRVLAAVTTAEMDPDRHAWHLARAQTPPDEAVASELEQAAGRSLARGAPAAAAAFEREAVAFTGDDVLRSRRAVFAAQAELLTGEYQRAKTLAADAQTGQLDDVTRLHAVLADAQISFAASRSNAVVPSLLTAARALESYDAALARATYLEAFSAALFSSSLAVEGGDVRSVAEFARSAPPAPEPTAFDGLLDSLARYLTTEETPAKSGLLRALDDVASGGVKDPSGLHGLWIAGIAAANLWDIRRWDELGRAHVRLARDLGALSELPIALVSVHGAMLWRGQLDTVAVVSQEISTITEATGAQVAPYTAISFAAWHGDEEAMNALVRDHLDAAYRRGEGAGVAIVEWTHALLLNSLGRSEEALGVARRGAAMRSPLDSGSIWALQELVEAAAQTGRTDEAREALSLLSISTRRAGTGWALGVEARSRALVGEGDRDEAFREAIDLCAADGVEAELARTHLLYGEWLRRQQRIREAREHLRSAHVLFSGFGADAFADRASRELRATGTTAPLPRRTVQSALTAQEEQVARLVAEGLSNPEVAARLFLSTRTVEYHLHKVFLKLGISSRAQLARTLGTADDVPGDSRVV